MLGLLLRVAVGVVATAAVAAIAYTVYKKITKKEIIEETTKQLMENDLFQEALIAKVNSVEKTSGTVKVDVLDSFDDPILEDITIHGEEIAGNIKKGQKIILDE